MKQIKNVYFLGQSVDNPDYFKSLNAVANDLLCPDLLEATGLDDLVFVGGNVELDSLVTAEGLGKLMVIGKNAVFTNLKTAKHLKSLKYIGGNITCSDNAVKSDILNIIKKNNLKK